MRLDVDVPPPASQFSQIGEGRLRAGEHDEIGVEGKGVVRGDELDIDVVFGDERIEVVEVGDSRKSWHDDANRSVAPRGSRTAIEATIESEGIFVWEGFGVVEERDHSETWDFHPRFEEGDSVVEQSGIAS